MSFVKNPNFENELAASPATREALRGAAERARPMVARMTHHAMPRQGHDQIEVQESGEDVYLVNTNWGAHLEEWGGADVRSPTYAPLRRGVRAAGFTLRAED
jgi:hypothetical protein